MLVEAAVLAYVGEGKTYERTGESYDCSRVAVWLWVGWIASLTAPARILARLARLGGSVVKAASLVPNASPAARRARSKKRRGMVERAHQVLVAIGLLHRALPEPPPDPSPLRWFLGEEFRRFRRKAAVTGCGFSPAMAKVSRSPPR